MRIALCVVVTCWRSVQIDYWRFADAHREGSGHSIAVGILGGKAQSDEAVRGVADIADQRKIVAAGGVVVEGGVEHHAGRGGRGWNNRASIADQCAIAEDRERQR